MTFYCWILTFLFFLSFVIYGLTAIINLTNRKNMNAIANFAYSITTLVASILIFATKSTAFFTYYIIVWGLAFGGLAYKEYKEGDYVFAIMHSIFAFFGITSFAHACFLALVA